MLNGFLILFSGLGLFVFWSICGFCVETVDVGCYVGLL